MTAIGKLILALATVVLAYFTYWTGKQAVKIAGEDRTRDDVRRADDRERDDRLRREQLDELERREKIERRDREDRDARQVTVSTSRKPADRAPTRSCGGWTGMATSTTSSATTQ